MDEMCIKNYTYTTQYCKLQPSKDHTHSEYSYDANNSNHLKLNVNTEKIYYPVIQIESKILNQSKTKSQTDDEMNDVSIDLNSQEGKDYNQNNNNYQAKTQNQSDSNLMA